MRCGPKNSSGRTSPDIDIAAGAPLLIAAGMPLLRILHTVGARPSARRALRARTCPRNVGQTVGARPSARRALGVPGALGVRHVLGLRNVAVRHHKMSAAGAASYKVLFSGRQATSERSRHCSRMCKSCCYDRWPRFSSSSNAGISTGSPVATDLSAATPTTTDQNASIGVGPSLLPASMLSTK